MDGRTSVWLLGVSLALGCTGCVNTQGAGSDKSTTTTTLADDASKSRWGDGPKRTAHPRMEIEMGKVKEAQADSEQGNANPEIQARLRDEARQAYQQALKADPDNLDAVRHLAKLYAKTGDYDRAFDTFKKALAKHPKEAPLWYDLGLCHNRRKEFNESMRCFNEAIKIDPENRAYLKTLGFTQAYRGQIDQGLATLIRAQGAALAHYNIARILVQRDQTEPAKQHLVTALRENGNLEDARELLNALADPNASRPPISAE